MRLIYVTDLHGDQKKYLACLEYAKKHHIDIIVNGGDALPKRGYLHIDQPQFIQDFFREYCQALEHENIYYLSMLGNDDMECFDELYRQVCQEFNHVYEINNQEVIIDGYSFIGMDRILDHPFRMKNRIVLENQTRLLDRSHQEVLIPKIDCFCHVFDWVKYASSHLKSMHDTLYALPTPKNIDKTIYVMHMPPLGLRLGEMYNGEDIGSEEIYCFLKEKQPLLSFHGHIHECQGKWMNAIGKTICIQPGQTELGADSMIIVDCDLEKGKFERIRINV